MADYRLNTKQQEAVEATEGRVKVVAGAGSGKTSVLVHRYAYLINELGVNPDNILCMTFTNKAATEMKNRIAKLTNSYNVNDFVCTIHGFCVKFIRKEGYRIGFPKNFSILDEEDEKVLAIQVMDECGISRSKETVKDFLRNISIGKSNSPYIADLWIGKPENISSYSETFCKYVMKQLKSFSLDFKDLIKLTIYILENFEEARLFWQDKLNYIMIDEAQDCNVEEWGIIEMLSAIYQNLFIVGDPDQCIYEWRGAIPKYYVNFKADKLIILDENYRSTPNILNVANSIIVHNKMRIEKNLTTNLTKGKIVLHYHGKDEKDESDWIAKQIKNLIDAGATPKDFAILYRASYLSRSIEQALVKKDLQYTIWGGIRFFERKEIKDSLAYLKLLAFEDDLSFIRIINLPKRSFGKASMEKLQAIAEEKQCSLMDALRQNIKRPEFNKEPLKKFLALFEKAKKLSNKVSLSDLFDYMLTESGLKEELRFTADEERLENIAELASSIKYYEELNENEDDIALEAYLQDIALYTNADYKKEGFSIKLMTIHQSKGLEFPYVFVCGLSEGIFPNHRSIRERRKNGEEEERRLMYVAVTRAEKALFLTESEGFNRATQSNKYPSRFLMEIGSNLLKVEGNIDPTLLEGTKNFVKQIDNEITLHSNIVKFAVGDKVEHAVFGIGEIIEATPERDSYKVLFEKGKRNLVGRVLRHI